MSVDIGKKVMAMSFYGKKLIHFIANTALKLLHIPLKHILTLRFLYPYPVAQSYEAANGMEYPMICFNFRRTEKDGTYSEGIKKWHDQV
ncbi:MAG: hypothetical protein IPP89_00485 [Saprospiraceae bacterium]|nr:hypothetical protein [Candidatus Brachybacter algidus]MBL0117486.1 hypothetical protein [Candidatus Brachybacter algidus]